MPSSVIAAFEKTLASALLYLYPVSMDSGKRRLSVFHSLLRWLWVISLNSGLRQLAADRGGIVSGVVMGLVSGVLGFIKAACDLPLVGLLWCRSS